MKKRWARGESGVKAIPGGKSAGTRVADLGKWDEKNAIGRREHFSTKKGPTKKRNEKAT